MTVDLNYTGSGGAQSFTIYRLNAHPIEIVRTQNESISGQLSEKTISYRRVIEVEFAPLGNDKIKAAYLWAFLRGAARSITFNAVTYDVTIEANELRFDFHEGTFFGDSFALRFKERSPSTITDTGSTRILKPLYTPSGEGISGETCSLFVNMCDDVSIDVVKCNFEYVNAEAEDVCFAYRHAIMIDTGPIYKSALETWINEFVQWQNKQIDTTAIDPDNGTIYSVIFDGMSIDWQICDGVQSVVSASLLFKEKTPRTTSETFVSSNLYDEVIFDEVIAQ